MIIVAYQLFIAFTLLMTRVLAPNYLALAAIVWSGFTLLNLFWPPLIILQLVVVWGTYAALANESGTAPPTSSTPNAKPAQSLPKPVPSSAPKPPASILVAEKPVASLPQDTRTREFEFEVAVLRSAIEAGTRYQSLEGELSNDLELRELFNMNKAKLRTVTDRLKSDYQQDHPRRVVVAIDLASETDEGPSAHLMTMRQAYLKIATEAVAKCRDVHFAKAFDDVLSGEPNRAALQRFDLFKRGFDWKSPKLESAPSAPKTIAKRVRIAPSNQRSQFDIALDRRPPVAVPLDPRLPIELAVAAREIEHLVHFTRLDNLKSIITKGLRSVTHIEEFSIVSVRNDQVRLDGRREGISLSITHPNYRMFYKYRENDADHRWVVLLLDPSILWEKSCGFFPRNAADHRMRSLELPKLKTHEAFTEMFGPIEGVQSREDQRLLPRDPTDPQAEVMVFEPIEPKYIKKIVFQSSNDFFDADYVDVAKAQVVQPNKDVFASRSYVRNVRVH